MRAMQRMTGPIPSSVRMRLTRYLTFVQELTGRSVGWVSSGELADGLGLTSSTVRQDMSYVDFSGVSKKGYETAGLERVLTKLLGADTVWNCVVVGAGNLGAAIARHEEFARRGFSIQAVFDNDPRKIGRKIGSLTIRSLDEMPAFVGRHRTDIGILAVPAAAAQQAADLLIASGIKGLMNMALAHLVAPRKVAVVDSRIVVSLLELTHLIKHPAQEKP
jgi:redox-sensing transcriptional repressor